MAGNSGGGDLNCGGLLSDTHFQSLFASVVEEGFLPKDKIHLGLDLQGGMHLILEVEADKAVENSAERLADDLKETMRTERVPFIKIEKAKGWNIDVQLAARRTRLNWRKSLKRISPS